MCILSSSPPPPLQWSRKIVGRDAEPVNVFANLGIGLKLVQFAAWLSYYLSLGPVSWKQIPLPALALGPVLILAGQTLNAAIYKAIGKVGVYYGTRLGKTVPWVTGFPFNVVSHPQYVGTVLCIWGITLLAYQDLHQLPIVGTLRLTPSRCGCCGAVTLVVTLLCPVLQLVPNVLILCGSPLPSPPLLTFCLGSAGRSVDGLLRRDCGDRALLLSRGFSAPPVLGVTGSFPA